MNTMTLYDSDELPHPQTFFLALASSGYLDSSKPPAAGPSPALDLNGAMAFAPNWLDQAIPGHVLPPEQALQQIPLQNLPFYAGPAATGVILPSSMDATANFHLSAMQTDASSSLDLQAQLAMNKSPMFSIPDGTFPISPGAPLFPSPLSTSLPLAPGQNLAYSTTAFVPGAPQCPSDMMYTLTLENDHPYSEYHPQFDVVYTENQYTNDPQAHFAVHLQPSPTYSPHTPSPGTTSPILPYDLPLFSPYPSVTTTITTPSITCPSTPKSLSSTESDLYIDSDEEEEEACPPKRRRRNRTQKPKSKDSENRSLSPKLLCSHPDCNVSCASLPSLARHEATHKWKGQYPPLRCEACLSTLSNEYSVQRHINRSKPESLCRLMRVYSFMKSSTEPQKTVRFYPKRAHGKKTVTVDLELVRTKYFQLGHYQSPV